MFFKELELAGWDYEQISPPLNDKRVDNIGDQSGEIDLVPLLSVDLPDADIIKNLDARINDSQTYWDIPEGFNLRESRNENVRLHLGRQIDVTHLYRFQVPYVENEIFVAVETIVAYLTSQMPQPEVYPAQDSQQSKKMALDLQKVLLAHSQQFQLDRKLEVAIRNLLLKRIGIIKFRFDPHYGKYGEIIPEVIDPEHVIVDKNAAMGENPDFICHVLKMTVEELCYRFPDKKKQIYEALGIVRGTPKQMSQTVAVREVWFTNYTKKDQPEEVVVWYFNKLILDKIKNPNWMYSGGSNFLEMPLKPFIPLNYINDGSHWIDITTPVEQAANMQNILNKRGRQIMENADKANGMLVISTDSGLTKDDAQNLTGDPNQKIIIKTAGQDVRNLVYQVPPHDLPSYVMEDKFDQRTTIHAIIGTPSEFTGSDDNQDKYETLGKAMMIKNQAAGRQDLIGRAVASFMGLYFQFLTQMMAVWYTDKHYFVYNGGDGEFDYVTMHREMIEKGMVVQVKSGTTQPFDKARQEATALQLAKMGMISPLDLYKDLHMDNTQKRYDNWYKWKTQPQALAMDAQNEVDDSEAYVDYIEIMGGRTAKPRDDATKEHILTHRKQMLTDEFLKAKASKQKIFVKHVQDELASLELRTSLDEMSQQTMELLNPSIPISPMQPSAPPMQNVGMNPQGPPMGMSPNGQPQAASLSGIFGGTGIPNPAAPQPPPLSNPSALPIV